MLQQLMCQRWFKLWQVSCLMLLQKLEGGGLLQRRSSSNALSTVLRRKCATCVADAIYLTLLYVPTGWNVADVPTRDVELHPVYDGLFAVRW